MEVHVQLPHPLSQLRHLYNHAICKFIIFILFLRKIVLTYVCYYLKLMHYNLAYWYIQCS